jgi:uncharacterized protein (TIGR02594 family)
MDDDPVWLARAQREIGIKERPGLADHPRILEYHGATKLHAKHDEVPWCSAFVCWVMEGTDIPSTRSAAARSWLTWGRKLDKPQRGCVVVLDRRSDDNPKAAHVAFYLHDEGDSVRLLGGNQGNAVSTKLYPKSRVLGYRWPVV